MPFSRYPSGSCPCQVSLPFELRHFPAGSLSPLSRIEFVSYRLVVLLRLLPTPPHDDAVAVEYGPENVCPVGTFTLLFKCAYERTGRTLRGPINSRHGGRRAKLVAVWKAEGEGQNYTANLTEEVSVPSIDQIRAGGRWGAFPTDNCLRWPYESVGTGRGPRANDRTDPWSSQRPGKLGTTLPMRGCPGASVDLQREKTPPCRTDSVVQPQPGTGFRARKPGIERAGQASPGEERLDRARSESR